MTAERLAKRLLSGAGDDPDMEPDDDSDGETTSGRSNGRSAPRTYAGTLTVGTDGTVVFRPGGGGS